MCHSIYIIYSLTASSVPALLLRDCDYRYAQLNTAYCCYWIAAAFVCASNMHTMTDTLCVHNWCRHFTAVLLKHTCNNILYRVLSTVYTLHLYSLQAVQCICLHSTQHCHHMHTHYALRDLYTNMLIILYVHGLFFTCMCGTVCGTGSTGHCTKLWHRQGMPCTYSIYI
jgi:hypothetical protein